MCARKDHPNIWSLHLCLSGIGKGRSWNIQRMFQWPLTAVELHMTATLEWVSVVAKIPLATTLTAGAISPRSVRKKECAVEKRAALTGIRVEVEYRNFFPSGTRHGIPWWRSAIMKIKWKSVQAINYLPTGITDTWSFNVWGAINKVEFKIIVYIEKQVTESDAYSFTTPVKFWKMKSWMWVLLVLEEFGRGSV